MKTAQTRWCFPVCGVYVIWFCVAPCYKYRRAFLLFCFSGMLWESFILTTKKTFLIKSRFTDLFLVTLLILVFVEFVLRTFTEKKKQLSDENFLKMQTDVPFFCLTSKRTLKFLSLNLKGQCLFWCVEVTVSDGCPRQTIFARFILFCLSCYSKRRRRTQSRR